jgi:hypothetical protein
MKLQDLEIKCRLITQTEAAYKVRETDSNKSFWVPKDSVSLVEDVNHIYLLTMPGWLAKEKGLL